MERAKQILGILALVGVIASLAIFVLNRKKPTYSNEDRLANLAKAREAKEAKDLRKTFERIEQSENQKLNVV